MAYLVRLRRLQFHAARATDKAMWTAADYSVMITGVIKHGIAHEEAGPHSVEAKLWGDLEQLGFKRKDIDHIELGVDCAREIQIGREVSRPPPPPNPKPSPCPSPPQAPLQFSPSPLTPLNARKVERLEVSKEELQARENSRQARGEPAQAEKEKASKVDKQLEELNEELEALQSEEHRTTGHVRGRTSRSVP